MAEANIAGLDTVLANLGQLENRALRATAEAADEIGHYLANYAKTHHRWTPRTGHTDLSTGGGIAEISREFVMAYLSAGMDYDVFLELAHQGKWAWLMPAVLANRVQIGQILTRHLMQANQV